MRWLAILAVALVVAGGARAAQVRVADVPMVASDATARGLGERDHVLRATSSPDKRFATATAPTGEPLTDRRDDRGVDHAIVTTGPALPSPHALPFATAPPVVRTAPSLLLVPPASRGPPRVLVVVTHLS